MELHDLIYSRQSVRRFKADPVPDKDILKILDAVRVGQSSENEQNWYFIVVRNEDFKNKLRELIVEKQKALSAELSEIDESRAKRFEKFTRLFTLFALDAPVLILIYSFTAPANAQAEYVMLKRPQKMIDELQLQSPAMMGLGSALEHAVLTMQEMGYGTTLMTSQNWLHKDIENLVEKEIGFRRDGWFLAAMMPVGKPDGELKSPGRKQLEDIVQFYR
ncbi:MAG: nitroreductase family protein [Anaerovoracaceae bacterium]